MAGRESSKGPNLPFEKIEWNWERCAVRGSSACGTLARRAHPARGLGRVSIGTPRSSSQSAK